VTAPALPAALGNAVTGALDGCPSELRWRTRSLEALQAAWPAVLAELEQARPAPAGFEAVVRDAIEQAVLECLEHLPYGLVNSVGDDVLRALAGVELAAAASELRLRGALERRAVEVLTRMDGDRVGWRSYECSLCGGTWENDEGPGHDASCPLAAPPAPTAEALAVIKSRDPGG
jgi:hypothetical protein